MTAEERASWIKGYPDNIVIKKGGHNDIIGAGTVFNKNNDDFYVAEDVAAKEKFIARIERAIRNRHINEDIKKLKVDTKKEIGKQYDESTFISNMGRVAKPTAVGRHGTRKLTITHGSITGDRMVFMSAAGKSRAVKDEVGILFNGKDISADQYIGHKNGKGGDNRVTNLTPKTRERS